ncbi:MAG TPA: hypothetical protein VL134_05450 [Leptolyngbya sp.]|jgi:hypothetical protein|nr:hypothetical protein [Leptolyngbya sp.]
MSHSAFFSTIETALSQTSVTRLMLEDCELLIGSEYGAVLLPTQRNVRSFEPMPTPLLASDGAGCSDWTGCEKTLGETLVALRTKRSIEVFGDDKTSFLQHLAQQSDLPKHYRHGILYLNQTDTLEDLLQTLFEQLYQVPSDVKPSREEIRLGLRDRQALILLDQATLTDSGFDQLQQTLPESVFVIASSDDRHFPHIETAIELPKLDLESSLLSESERTVLELLATVETSLSAAQIRAIAQVSEVQKLINLKFIHRDQGRYKLQIRYQRSDFWMEQVLRYVLEWIRSQPSTIVQERKLLMATLKWSADQKRWSEVLEIARSIEGAFAIAKRWGNWSEILRWSLAAAWALEDETSESWALHQLGTLAFCQEEVTVGYDRLRDALDLRRALGEPIAIAVSQHNLTQIKALIVPVEDRSQTYQRYFYWIVGLICAIAFGVLISVSISTSQQPSYRDYISLYGATLE